MKDFQQFTLLQLQQIIADNNQQMANNYISQNLAVAREVKLSLIKEQLRDGPWIMHEMRILIVLRGWINPVVNLMERRFEAGDLVYLGAEGILQFRDSSPDVHGIGLSFSNDLFSLAIGNTIPRAFDGHLRDFHFHLQPHDLEFLDSIHHLLYINTRAQGYSSQATLHLISTFLWYIDNLWSRHEETSRSQLSREQQLFADFMQLVSQYATQQHILDFYADRLCLSPRYMSTIIRRISGKAAKEWIDDAIVTRIKVELRHSGKTVAQIADDMNFPNPSFFCKFFKRMTGLTPREYQKA